MLTNKRVTILVSKMQGTIDRARRIDKHEKYKYEGAVET